MQQEEINTSKEKLNAIFQLEQLGETNLEQLKMLIQEYPYCHTFYLLAAKSAVGTSSYDKYLAEAAAIAPSRNILYDVIHHPEKLTVTEQISVAEPEDTKEAVATEDEVILEEIEQEDTLTQPIADLVEEEALSEIDDEEVLVEEVVEELEEQTITEAPYIETLGDEYLQEDELDVNTTGFTDSAQTNLPVVSQPNIFRYHEERLPYTFLWWLNKTRKQYENIRPYADFYLDTTLPIEKKSNVLDHQIAENIFHLTSTDELDKEGGNRSTVPFDFMRKEHQIIERFIKEEPHITAPPPANKIDTENKAKRSSEDDNELVSETLAKVYVEQMLYHKALDIYRKLSLKYPEKNAYFASQIKYLELKVN